MAQLENPLLQCRTLDAYLAKTAENRQRGSSPGASFVRTPQLSDIELLHLQKRLCHAPDLLRCAVLQHRVHVRRDNLPGQPVLVLEPAALLGRRTAESFFQ